MTKWPFEKPAWLPIVMPRPRLFSDPEHWPDLAPIKTPHILELRRSYQREFDLKTVRKLIRSDPLRTTPVEIDRSSDCWQPIVQSSGHSTLGAILTSLPIFTEVYLFARGTNNNGLDLLERMEDISLLPGEREDFMGIISRTFVTWSARNLIRNPLYRTDRMIWREYLPEPDFSGWPEGVPAQVIVPFERPHYSAHKRLALRAEMEDDLRFFSIANAWGPPLKPVWIDMPDTMEELIGS